MAKLSRFDIESTYEKERVEFVRPDRKRGEKPKMNISVPSNGHEVRMSPGGTPVRIWADTLDTAAFKQAARFADLDCVHPHGVALMPDIHPGKDVPVGCVLPTIDALVPAAVGVDIGCGVLAVQLDLGASDLPDDLKPLRLEIEARVPVDRVGKHRGAVSQEVMSAWGQLDPGHRWLLEHYPKAALGSSSPRHLGTLGGGNHFIEVCLDQSKRVWVMLHSGSRGIGAAVGRYFMEQAQGRVRANGDKTPAGLGWFAKDDPLFDGYAKGVAWAQDVARINRELMLASVLGAIESCLGRRVVTVGSVVSCHHNYVSMEHHFGQDVWITRKGAISAQRGQMGVIPSAMGKESLIVEGLGNPQSWCSCSHGTGRVLSRSAAKERFTVEDLRRQTAGLECRKVRGLVDEIPSAYKPLGQVMANQRDLVQVKHRIKAVLCVKGE